MLQNHWQHLTPVFALLIFGLVGVGCDSSGLSGPDERGVDGQTTTRQGPPAGVPGGPPSGVPGGPPADVPRGDNDADVRVAHLSPDAPAVDVFVGNEPNGNPAIGDLTYPNFAPNASGDYVDLAPGTYNIAVTPAGATEPQVIDVDGFPLEPNKDYTILAVGELSPENDEPGIQAIPLVDNADEQFPPGDSTLVRFVHASPDAGAVDIGVKGGPTLLEGVEFGDASGYIAVAPGDYTITVGPGALEVPFTAEAGKKVTAYVIGNATPEPGDAPLEEDDEGLSAVTSVEATNPSLSAPGRGPARR